MTDRSDGESTTDDFDDASTTQGVSRSVRPAAGRSLSYGGSSATGSTTTYDNNGFLNRQDTIRTNTTAGMAGRGVPGQLFTFNPIEYNGGSGNGGGLGVELLCVVLCDVS